jgi:hypothetical protein
MLAAAPERDKGVRRLQPPCVNMCHIGLGWGPLLIEHGMRGWRWQQYQMPC